MAERKPLLSICVPTYNRAEFLRVMLQALLPQAAKHRDTVEVWVVDNASPDNTAQVIEESQSLGPFRTTRNAENIGSLGNIVKAARDLADGEYVWILGDHNLMRPGTLDNVIAVLQEHQDLDLFYVNFRCAKYPDQWPESAIDGYDGPYDMIANAESDDRQVSQWNEFVRTETAYCTQAYAHIVRAKIWKDYWKDRDTSKSHFDPVTTYPHTFMMADVAFTSPSFYIGQPAVTIFNGAQSWSNVTTQFRVFLVGLPGLISLFQKRGLGRSLVNDARRKYAAKQFYQVVIAGLSNGQLKASGVLAQVLMRWFRDPWLLPVAVRAMIDSRCCLPASMIKSLQENVRNRRQSWLYNCRPARWLRRRFTQG